MILLNKKKIPRGQFMTLDLQITIRFTQNTSKIQDMLETTPKSLNIHKILYGTADSKKKDKHFWDNIC